MSSHLWENGKGVRQDSVEGLTVHGATVGGETPSPQQMQSDASM